MVDEAVLRCVWGGGGGGGGLCVDRGGTERMCMGEGAGVNTEAGQPCDDRFQGRGATNRPWMVDEAVLRWVGVCVYVCVWGGGGGDDVIGLTQGSMWACQTLSLMTADVFVDVCVFGLGVGMAVG